MKLAPYAASDETSRGRRHQELPPSYRSEYQRDRDRIIHSTAFRRLEYKTQVFVNHEGDLFRTRLTHSIEVAQIGRSISRALHVNEDLVEAIALAHDLGHTPFGHAGQDALNDCMCEHGGFEHNLQSLRVVDKLEEKYADFNGLNLTFETREGILKHCSARYAQELGDVGERFLNGTQASIEAQLTNFADEIAYNSHDVDDGLRSGLIDFNQLNSVSLFAEYHAAVIDQYVGLTPKRITHEIVRRIINSQVSDLIETSLAAISRLAPDDIDTVRSQPEKLIRFSDGMLKRHLELKRFLRNKLYRHYRVHRMTVKAGRIIRALFRAFNEDPHLLPQDHRIKITDAKETGGDQACARIVADYIAGMTDRYAIAEYNRLFEPDQLT